MSPIRGDGDLSSGDVFVGLLSETKAVSDRAANWQVTGEWQALRTSEATQSSVTPRRLHIRTADHTIARAHLFT